MINVIGLGYIGLPTALMLAANGQKVIGTDYKEDLICALRQGEVTFQENGLIELFHQAIENNITFTSKYECADVYIISVPTPYMKSNKRIDASYVIRAVQDILKVCKKGAVLIIESTVSPGTIHHDIRPVIEESGYQTGVDLHLVHAPERIIPGNMVEELRNNCRTIGADDPVIGERVKHLYESFCQGEIIVTDIRTAEMTKVVENTFRDINIAYANELAKICRSDDMNVYEIIRIANKHPRVNILNPGPGVGGHCISVDPWFLVGDYPGLANIILAARKINDSMPDYVLERIHNIMASNHLTEVGRVGLYGMTYKEDVDDYRESPTLQILDSMERHLTSGVIKMYDPYITQDIVPNQYHNLDDFLENIDMVVIMVGHKEILENSYKLKGKIILDTRSVLDGEKIYSL